ncbi:MAG: IS1634 family transposase [Pseudonocardiaceae bacterium]
MGKRRGRQTYYYLVESARVGGRPRIVGQEYLGTAEEVMGRLAAGDTAVPERTQHRAFGDVAAVWSMLQRLNVAGIIDAVVGGRRADAVPSVGCYLALATLNRVVAPCSKLAFADWWATTAGPRFTKVAVSSCDHRRFWDAMDAIGVEQLVEIERAIDARMVDLFDLDLSGLVLDMTNFATFIDTGNNKAPIAQRGRAKQKRNDLRLVGLGLVVSRDGGVPLVCHAYPGNRPDVTQFIEIIDELVARYRDLAGGVDDLTVVFDAGNDSADNQHHLTSHRLHYVGSLAPSQHPDLLAIPARKFTVVDPDRFGGLTAYQSTTQALGATRRVVLTHSPTFHARQARGFAQTLAKAHRQLAELQTRLGRGRTRRSRDAVQAEIDRICRPRWLGRVLTVTLTGDQPNQLRLSWRTDPTARRQLENEIFGKRILFTDRTDWPVAEVIAAYRSQADAEAGFRQLKDPHVVSFSPMFHWTDQKIRVHAFYCVLALTIAHLMRREAARAGLTMSVRELLTTLAGIQETVLLYPGERGRPRARRILTDLDPTQRRLHQLFDLDQHAPRR